MSNISEHVADEMSRKARVNAALFMVRNLTTEDIERLNAEMPNMADCAFHEILNPTEVK